MVEGRGKGERKSLYMSFKHERTFVFIFQWPLHLLYPYYTLIIVIIPLKRPFLMIKITKNKNNKMSLVVVIHFQNVDNDNIQTLQNFSIGIDNSHL